MERLYARVRAGAAVAARQGGELRALLNDAAELESRCRTLDGAAGADARQRHVGKRFYVALLRATLRDGKGAVPPSLAGALHASGLWSDAELVRRYAIGGDTQRNALAHALAPGASDDLRVALAVWEGAHDRPSLAALDALSRGLSPQGEARFLEALAAIVRDGAQGLQGLSLAAAVAARCADSAARAALLERVFLRVAEMTSEHDVTCALVDLAAHGPALRGARLDATVRAARDRVSPSTYGRELPEWVDLASDALVEELFDEARRYENDRLRGAWLVAIAPRLPVAHWDALRDEVQRIERPAHRGAALAAMSARSAGCERAVLVREALRALHAITAPAVGYPGSSVERSPALRDVLMPLAPLLTRDQLREVFEVERAKRIDADLAAVLCVLAPHLDAAIADEAFASARAIAHDAPAAAACAALVPRVSAGLRDAAERELTARTRALRGRPLYDSAWHRTLEALSTPTRDECLTALLDERGSPAERETLRAIVAARPSEAGARALLDDAARRDDPRWLGATVAMLAPGEADALVRAALAEAPAPDDVTRRSALLDGLLPCLDASQRAVALDAARALLRVALRGAHVRAVVALMVALAQRLPEAQRTEVLTEALAVAQNYDLDAPARAFDAAPADAVAVRFERVAHLHREALILEIGELERLATREGRREIGAALDELRALWPDPQRG